MQVIKFLKKYGLSGEKQLKDKYHIKIKEYNDRIVLNYNQIDSPKFDSLVMECRGLILSKSDYNILARSFKRFWNFTEDPNKKNFDCSKAICYEKLDGSLIYLYHDNKQWEVATRGTAFAEGNLPGNNTKTFRQLFMSALHKPFDHITQNFLNKNCTYVFEIVSPENRIVTPYTKTELYLLTIVTNHNGKEANFQSIQGLAKKIGVKTPKFYKFNNIEQIMHVMKKLPVLEEGYVCHIPESNWRIKIKNPSYLAVAHLRDNNGIINPKRIALLVLSNDHLEYLASFPEDKPLFEPYLKAYQKMINEIKELWQKYHMIKNQKEFALSIESSPAKNILFSMRNKKKSLGESIENLSENAKIRLLESYK